MFLFVFVFLFLFFFFQAEDGIRDAQESRGLGDVYKRQEHGDVSALSIYANQLKQQGSNVLHGAIREVSLVPVSYTHLTLPTIYSV